MKPVCVPCERFMRPKQNGYRFVEGMPDGNEPRPNIGKGATGWTAYKIWAGDLWHCPTCGAQVVVGVGSQPISQTHWPDFKERVAETNGILVKDC